MYAILYRFLESFILRRKSLLNLTMFIGIGSQIDLGDWVLLGLTFLLAAVGAALFMETHPLLHETVFPENRCVYIVRLKEPMAT